MFLLTTFALYAFILQVVHALHIVKRDVVDPHITEPYAGQLWTPGYIEVVTWYFDLFDYYLPMGIHCTNLNPRDTSTIPSTGDFTGTVLFGTWTDGSEFIDLSTLSSRLFFRRVFDVPFRSSKNILWQRGSP
jgi:hypothetical protein